MTSETAARLVSAIGTSAMLAASLCGMFEHMEKEGHNFIMALQPQYASVATAVDNNTNDDQFRRAGNREEVHHASATYGAVKRTPSVSGAV